jgi:hypothetical protein
VASNDWREIDPYNTQLQTFRAIEHGYSLVRQTSNGLAMAVDYEGNVLAASDYFTTDQQTMVASVPTRGVRTISSGWQWFAGDKARRMTRQNRPRLPCPLPPEANRLRGACHEPHCAHRTAR